jgi:hypothetical protein
MHLLVEAFQVLQLFGERRLGARVIAVDLIHPAAELRELLAERLQQPVQPLAVLFLELLAALFEDFRRQIFEFMAQLFAAVFQKGELVLLAGQPLIQTGFVGARLGQALLAFPQPLLKISLALVLLLVLTVAFLGQSGETVTGLVPLAAQTVQGAACDQ